MSNNDVASIPSTSNPTGSSPSVEASESAPFVREDNSWHYSFNIPWNKISSTTVKILDAEKRPSAAERREISRIVAAEMLTVCKKLGKRHVSEIIRYTKSFQDEIEGQVVGTGYDSLVKQFISRIDTCRRLQVPATRKRLAESDSPDSAKKASRDAYGCINPEPELPVGETKQLQEQKQVELQKMYKDKDKDTK